MLQLGLNFRASSSRGNEAQNFASSVLSYGSEPGTLEPGIRLVWMRLPEQGTVEVLYGALHFNKPTNDPAELRTLLTQAGYQPFTIAASQTPVVQADTAETLCTRINRLAPPVDGGAKGKDSKAAGQKGNPEF